MPTINGYRAIGHGPRRVLGMSGQFGSSADWTVVAQAMNPELFSLVWFDYRGFGESRSRTGSFTLDEIAGDVLDVVGHLQWDEFGLIGHSMGGMFMQKVMLAAGGRVRRMAAITPVSAAGVRMNAERQARFDSAVLDVDVRAAIIHASTGGRLTRTWAKQCATQSWESSDPRAFAGYLKQWTSVDFVDDILGASIPVEIIVGEHDATLTPAVMEHTWLASYPNSKLNVMPNAGHYPMFETPLALAAALERFFE